jgi:glutamate transport system permease protein
VDAILDNLDMFASGFIRSLGICLWALAGSLALGTLIVACRLSPLPALRWFGTSWVTLIRNCPLTVVLFMFAFGFPELGVNQSYYVFGVAALVVYTSAFVCEALRAGVSAVPPGQAEAARATGMTFGQTLGAVMLPQAFAASVPPLGSVIIGMFKNSAVVGAFGVGQDLYSVYKNLTSARGYEFVPVLTGVAIGYLLITLGAGLVLAMVERKVAVAR